MPAPLRLLAPAFAAMLAASPALAQTTEADPALLYEVAEDEPLELRAQPGLDGEVLAELPPGTRDVVLSGAAMEAEGERFVAVLREGRNQAWARADALAAQEGEPDESFPLLCLGTEPFWSLEIAGDDAVFETPDISPVSWAASDWLAARGLLGRWMIRLSGGYGEGHLALLRQTCSDGMSDIAFPFETIVITPGRAVRAGCCRRTGER